jgi:hypothetical protein
MLLCIDDNENKYGIWGSQIFTYIYNILSRDKVTIEGVWIGNRIYCIFENSDYN